MLLVYKLKISRYCHQQHTSNWISHTGIAPSVYSPLLPITTSDSSTCLTYKLYLCKKKKNPCSPCNDVLFQDQQDYKDQAVSISITTPKPGRPVSLPYQEKMFHWTLKTPKRPPTCIQHSYQTIDGDMLCHHHLFVHKSVA